MYCRWTEEWPQLVRLHTSHLDHQRYEAWLWSFEFTQPVLETRRIRLGQHYLVRCYKLVTDVDSNSLQKFPCVWGSS